MYGKQVLIKNNCFKTEKQGCRQLSSTTSASQRRDCEFHFQNQKEINKHNNEEAKRGDQEPEVAFCWGNYVRRRAEVLDRVAGVKRCMLPAPHLAFQVPQCAPTLRSQCGCRCSSMAGACAACRSPEFHFQYHLRTAHSVTSLPCGGHHAQTRDMRVRMWGKTPS